MNPIPYRVFRYQSVLRDIQHQLRVLEVLNLDLNSETVSSTAGVRGAGCGGPGIREGLVNFNATGHRPLPKLSPTNASTCIDATHPLMQVNV